jgi:hypothetical protein
MFRAAERTTGQWIEALSASQHISNIGFAYVLANALRTLCEELRGFAHAKPAAAVCLCIARTWSMVYSWGRQRFAMYNGLSPSPSPIGAIRCNPACERAEQAGAQSIVPAASALCVAHMRRFWRSARVSFSASSSR